MNILFVGSILNEKELRKYTAASVAGNKMQIGILRGIYDIDENIECISIKPRSMFKYWNKDKFLNRGEKLYIDNLIKCKYVFYINFVILKQISIFISLFIDIIKWALKSRKEKKIILVYNTISYIALPCIIASKLFNCLTVGIIADLPIQDSKKSIFKKLEDRVEINLIKYLDALIPLTKYTALDFAKNKPFLVIEAGQNINKEINKEINKSKIKQVDKNINVVFSGTLNELSGIELALETFSKLESYYVLNIYGKGERVNIVKTYTQLYDNIVYHGTVDNEKMMEIQSSANILICPRMPDDFTTKYTFPSKVLEYMKSGTPVICNKLDGIPDEYYKYINVPEAPESFSWCEMIRKIGKDKNELYVSKAKEANKFLINEKTWNKQSKKIYEFIKGVG